MKALSLVVLVLALFGMGAVVVSIMGSGPCTPPPCTPETEGELCQLACNGPDTYCCKEGVCGNCAPCSADECPPAPPCSTAVCINPAYCGDSSAESVLCCRYDFLDSTSPCPVEGDDPENSDGWRGKCNDEHQCVEVVTPR